jgi:16S rRNA (guanine966-N2)-methyltransferase
VRIIAGKWKGRALASLGKGDAKAHLRPTTDRTRESLFSILTGGRLGDPLTGARVLDLFAGTGALGLEALSRGAAHATFVDSGRTAQKLITANIRACDAEDLIFLDPPYGADLGLPALNAAMADGWVAPQALAVWEETQEQPAPKGFEMLDTRRFGDTWITFLKANP